MKILHKSLTILLTLALALGVIFSTTACGWFGNNTDKPGGGNDINPGGDNTAVIVDGDGNILNGNNIYQMPASMAFIATTAASVSNPAGVTLTATVLPDTATNKKLDWSVAWATPEGVSKGGSVTSFVTITPSADGSNVATVKCLKPFGYQIKIVVTSRSNTAVKTECVLDYLSYFNDDSLSSSLKHGNDESIDIEITDGTLLLPAFTDSFSFSDFFSAAFIQSDYSVTVGTISDIKEKTISIECLSKGAEYLSVLFDIAIEDIAINGSVEWQEHGEIALLDIFSALISKPFDSPDEEDIQEFLWCLEESEEPAFIVDFLVDHNHHQDFGSYSIAIFFDTSVSLRYIVNEIILGDSSLIFG